MNEFDFRWCGRYHKGAMKALRELKREEAEDRNACTPEERTAAYRRRAWALAVSDAGPAAVAPSSKAARRQARRAAAR